MSETSAPPAARSILETIQIHQQGLKNELDRLAQHYPVIYHRFVEHMIALSRDPQHVFDIRVEEEAATATHTTGVASDSQIDPFEEETYGNNG